MAIKGPSEAVSRQQRGRLAEQLACDFLLRRGFEILERNVHCGGVELDVIARDPASAVAMVVIVEVRSRASSERGSPLETVGRTKQARLRRGATAWLVAHNLWERVAVRFDVFGVVFPPEGAPELTWVADAFRN